MKIDPNLYKYCAQRQHDYLEAIERNSSVAAAARELGIDARTIFRALEQVRKKAALQGYSPDHDMIKTAPDTHVVKGVSTLYDVEGGVKMQWVKTNLRAKEMHEALSEVVETLCDEARGRGKVGKAPKTGNKNTLTVYPMGDPHIGMYAWHRETGADFDVDIASRHLVGAMSRLVTGAPASDQAIVLNLGDFFHSDTDDNRTRRSGHALDVDTRWARVLELGTRALQDCVDLAAQKHRCVYVVNVIGNHDDQSSVFLSQILNAYYRKEKRVTVSTHPGQFQHYRFGKTLLGMTHGHNVKPEQLVEVMASEWPKEWGETEYRYWLTGHIHTRKVWESRGCLVESFRTLAPRDAWGASMGYRAGQDMHRITYDRRFGEAERQIVTVRQLGEAA